MPKKHVYIRLDKDRWQKAYDALVALGFEGRTHKTTRDLSGFLPNDSVDAARNIPGVRDITNTDPDRQVDHDKVAKGIGGERRGRVSAGGGYFGALGTAADRPTPDDDLHPEEMGDKKDDSSI